MGALYQHRAALQIILVDGFHVLHGRYVRGKAFETKCGLVHFGERAR